LCALNSLNSITKSGEIFHFRQDWLLAQGHAQSAITVVAFGEKRPRAANDSELDRAANRRVELVVSSVDGLVGDTL